MRLPYAERTPLDFAAERFQPSPVTAHASSAPFSAMRHRRACRFPTLSLAVVFALIVSTTTNAEQTVRVASISFVPEKFNVAYNADKLDSMIRKAARGGAQLAVAPEGILEGYVVNEIIAGDAAAAQMRDLALPIDSPVITRFRNLAQALNICLVFGFAERVAEDVFNCAVFIDHSGAIRGKYHKMQFAEGYDEHWWFNRLGNQSRAFDTPFGRCGILICNDRWNPQLATIPALDGAQFLVIPSFGSTSRAQDDAVLSRGIENDLPIIEANVGVTLIVNKNKIAVVERESEGVTFADIDIPAPRPIKASERDEVEREFLAWRADEMPRRLAQRRASVGSLDPLRTQDGTSWFRAQEIGIEGKGWDDTETAFDRLPARARGVVRAPVWSLSQQSAGLCIRFSTNSSDIHVRWKLRSETLALPHMPATGVSGVDLYVRHEGRWRWLANGRPLEVENSAQLAKSLPPAKRDYLLYFPLYNGVTSLEVGIDQDASLFLPQPQESRPIVFWGTSITQGACASRPGMCHTAILHRWLDRPVINLGFSGNGRMEPEVAQLMAELDAAVFVVDCLPNIRATEVRARTRRVVEILREHHPDTPILLVEDRDYTDGYVVASKRKRNESSQAALREQFAAMQADGIAHLHYLEGHRLLGEDGEDTVDTSHPTDLGFYRQAQAFKTALVPLLEGR